MSWHVPLDITVLIHGNLHVTDVNSEVNSEVKQQTVKEKLWQFTIYTTENSKPDLYDAAQYNPASTIYK